MFYPIFESNIEYWNNAAYLWGCRCHKTQESSKTVPHECRYRTPVIKRVHVHYRKQSYLGHYIQKMVIKPLNDTNLRIFACTKCGWWRIRSILDSLKNSSRAFSNPRMASLPLIFSAFFNCLIATSTVPRHCPVSAQQKIKSYNSSDAMSIF